MREWDVLRKLVKAAKLWKATDREGPGRMEVNARKFED
jgi:hypothetical protein